MGIDSVYARQEGHGSMEQSHRVGKGPVDLT
jgi:hypothetical protein